MLKIDRDKLHHAYCVVGERVGLLEEVSRFCNEELKHETQGNPDFWIGEFDSLGIDEGRMIKEMQEKKAFGGGRKVFVVAANTMTLQAQNSLLKVFEEPTPQTHFFLIMPSVHMLLPTLRSRLQIVETENVESATLKWEEAEKFLKMGKGERIVYAKNFAEEISDEVRTRSEVVMLLSGIESVLRKKIGNRLFTKEEAFVFSELLKCRDFFMDRSASVKMLLEHLSLIIP